jgi:hypothetical protein
MKRRSSETFTMYSERLHPHWTALQVQHIFEPTCDYTTAFASLPPLPRPDTLNMNQTMYTTVTIPSVAEQILHDTLFEQQQEDAEPNLLNNTSEQHQGVQVDIGSMTLQDIKSLYTKKYNIFQHVAVSDFMYFFPLNCSKCTLD